LEHIQADKTIKLEDVIRQKKDLYGIEEFFDNYTQKRDRNYKIHCVKYEDFFERIQEFNRFFDLKDDKNLYPKEVLTSRTYHYSKELEEIYSNLIKKMERMDFITTV